MLGEAPNAHVTPKCLGPRPLGAKAVPFSVAAPAMALDACAVLGVCPIIFPASLKKCLRVPEEQLPMEYLDLGGD
jgi:hypothetical protein